MTMRKNLASLSVAFAALGWAASGVAAAEEFSGLYIGAEVEHKNIIAGAQVGGVDMLAQDSRLGGGLVGGWRHQFTNDWVIGLEGGWGAEDSSLGLSVPASGLTIAYDNGAYWRIGAILGVVLGVDDRTLLYGYVHETTRDFDVTINQGATTTSQQDEQGLLSYGIGVERKLNARTSVRASLGSSRAEFDGVTSMDPDQPIDFSLGLLVQFPAR